VTWGHRCSSLLSHVADMQLLAAGKDHPDPIVESQVGRWANPLAESRDHGTVHFVAYDCILQSPPALSCCSFPPQPCCAACLRSHSLGSPLPKLTTSTTWVGSDQLARVQSLTGKASA
jgi:hypothetical protein